MQFATGSMLDGLYWESEYNGEPLVNGSQGYIYYANKLLGRPRLRLLRVRDHACDVADAFRREIKDCFVPYSVGSEDRASYGPNRRSTAQMLFSLAAPVTIEMFCSLKLAMFFAGYYIKVKCT